MSINRTLVLLLSTLVKTEVDELVALEAASEALQRNRASITIAPLPKMRILKRNDTGKEFEKPNDDEILQPTHMQTINPDIKSSKTYANQTKRATVPSKDEAHVQKPEGVGKTTHVKRDQKPTPKAFYTRRGAAE